MRNKVIGEIRLGAETFLIFSETENYFLVSKHEHGIGLFSMLKKELESKNIRRFGA